MYQQLFSHNNNLFQDLVRINSKHLIDKTLSINKISKLIKNSSEKKEIIINLFKTLSNTNCDEEIDWNIGNILEKIETNDLLDVFQNLDNKFYLYNSAGLAWALGEHKKKNTDIIYFLKNVLTKTKNQEAWWQAAFSIEKICEEDAITLMKHNLKNEGLCPLSDYLKKLNEKKSTIGILLQVNSRNIKTKIYPKIKFQILNTKNKKTLINSIWLSGRLHLIDSEIENKILNNFRKTEDYEMIHTILFALNENSLPRKLEDISKHIYNKNPKIRKMCIKCINNIDSSETLKFLEEILFEEEDPEVISELTQSIYKLKNNHEKEKNKIFKKYCENENGLIIDETDKWYENPEIYNKFSEAEDPENICFRIIIQQIKKNKIKIINPLDIATGTGKIIKKIINEINYEGTAHAIDINQKMLNHLKKSLIRKKSFTNKIKLIKSKTENIELPCKSSFIISCFGFPSKISDLNTCINELRKINSLLTEKGVFITIGWDESFNDELNEMWFKYLPDKIKASNFEEWRIKRKMLINTPRNCGLTWLKKELKVPLQFDNIYDSSEVMSHLFGRDALKEIINTKKTSWVMSLGITYNTKKDIEKILEEFDERNRNFNGVA
ncbi:MAG: methyltransferase domain-containing protein [Candidatus ainarchaeum sp.]|jgi:ubiquinone/menaquinone biosynthesis C-methylase UbiE|nr:methyltransferase domain-containing protein [Candidatus ainarchaeum sp.]